MKEITVDNKYMKQIRLVDGVLINIYKCEFGADLSCNIESRKQIDKMEEYFYQTKEVIVDRWCNKEYPIGTVLYKPNSCNYFPILKLNNYDSYDWELKTTGCSFSGNTEKFKEMVIELNDIIKNENTIDNQIK